MGLVDLWAEQVRKLIRRARESGLPEHHDLAEEALDELLVILNTSDPPKPPPLFLPRKEP